MEKGELRADANISVRKPGEPLGVKVELKNLNSFKAIEEGLKYEIERQIKTLESGQKVVQETRLYDESEKVTKPMRTKEMAHDYRYFPEPDLLPLKLTREFLEFHIPELPWQKKKRFIEQYGLRKDVVEAIVSERVAADWFEELIKGLKNYRMAANWLVNRVFGLVRKVEELNTLKFGPKELGDLLRMVEENKISQDVAKEIFEKMAQTGESPESIATKEGLLGGVSEELLKKLVEETIKNNPELVQKFKKGKTGVIGPLIGEIMKKTSGRANPQKAKELLLKALEAM
jgi:aspartyl-tRNA(Asn)/glutamyl-tRNA(Gln) amidotransferase subunit B